VLQDAVGARYAVCPKVALRDLVFVAQPQRNMAYVNKVQGKHVDFVLCDPYTMRPVAAVELDDSSHSRADRRERDEFVNRALEAAGLPVIRQRAARRYEPRALREAVLAATAPTGTQQDGPPNAGEPATTAVPSAEQGIPLCPKCGVPMVRRVAKRGEHRGQAFFGCPSYPRCRETIQG
jgi:hypothetical protein